ncbi:MAG: cold-shock protein [Deltaproteobacteria bacterium CG11_big_fil_rev_8_21_14_0_20_45_16]|nr:MAG: cold-shock protein [Deltaproteobacteria bacterium CG11_big_fil_rev_8_21_14_0_20_45_16]
MRGEVAWFNEAKGYGEIVCENGNKFFAHYTEIKSPEEIRNLKSGQTVRFNPDEEIQFDFKRL